ncbi:uncharacterized protein LOC142339074 isoform X2 [Convolutriloba macropyga]|uniref:uncharacterized protein LOC142339074 isoform X2 n=1 Tax=Convolutriloba macropyga TaxID=536237 RepID=UPI003F52889C
MLKLFALFIVCCYPAVANAKSKNDIEFTSTYPKEMQVLKHDVVTIKCPALSGVPRKTEVRYFFRFLRNKGGYQKEIFLNRSEGQFQLNDKTGELTINDFDEQNVGRYSCLARVPTLQGRVVTSSTLKIVLGSKQENTHQNDRLVTVGDPDDARLYEISKPTCLLKGTQANPLLYVEWSTLVPSGVIMTSQQGGGGVKMEEFSDFVVQMMHHLTFNEDWHNLTLIHNTHPTGPNNYHASITNLETGYGQYRILGLTNSGRAVQSPLSEGLTVPGSSSHHHSPGEVSGGENGGGMSVVPIITTLVSISETSVLLEWKMEPNYDVTGIVDRFRVVYRRVQNTYDSSHPANNNNPSFNSGSDPHASSLSHPWEQDVHVDNPNRRSCVVTNLLVNTKYQFTLEALGPHGIKSSSQSKIIVTGIGAGPWTESGPIKEQSKDKESGSVMMMLVIGGCVSVVLVVIVISVSILLLYKQRLNNNITNKVIMREMEEELKRRENSLRKSVGGVIYHQVAAALQHQHQSTQPTTNPPSTSHPSTQATPSPPPLAPSASVTPNAAAVQVVAAHQQMSSLSCSSAEITPVAFNPHHPTLIPTAQMSPPYPQPATCVSSIALAVNPHSQRATPPLLGTGGVVTQIASPGDPRTQQLMVPAMVPGSSGMAAAEVQSSTSPSGSGSFGFLQGWRMTGGRGNSRRQSSASNTSYGNYRYLMASPQSEYNPNASTTSTSVLHSPSSDRELMSSKQYSDAPSGLFSAQNSTVSYDSSSGAVQLLATGSDTFSPMHSYQSSNVTALSSVGDSNSSNYAPICTKFLGGQLDSSAPSQLTLGGLGSLDSPDDQLLMSSSGNSSSKMENPLAALGSKMASSQVVPGSIATVEHASSSGGSEVGVGGGGGVAAGPSTSQQHSCCHESQPCACHQNATSTNIEQGSLLGSGCSEHSVNSSPIGMDEQAYMQHHNLQGHPQIAIIQPTSGGIRQPSITPPISAQALPGVLAVSGAAPFRAQPNVYEYNTSVMPNPNSIYNTSNVTSLASSFHPIAEIRGPLIHSNMSSPVTTIALPQPLKTLNSPALIAKYTTGNVPLTHQNTYTSPVTGQPETPDFASSFKNLKDLSVSGTSDISNPGAGFGSSTLSRPLKGHMGPKTTGASNTLSQRNSIHNYTIDEDDLGANGSSMSNYQALPSAGEQLNSSGISHS